jgi:hypothetical protein
MSSPLTWIARIALPLVLAFVAGAPAWAQGGLPGKPLATQSGAVTVTQPTGPGWQCQEKLAPGTGVSMLVCRRADRAEFFFLMAKVYTAPASDRKTAKELALQVFPKNYARLFSTSRIASNSAVKLGRLVGHEIVLEAKHASMGDIKKTERVFVKGDQVFILSGEGLPAMHGRFAKEMAAWFAGTRFKGL